MRVKIASSANISIRMWPFVTSIILMLGLFSPNIFQPSRESMGQVSATSLVIFFCSIAFPLFAIYSLINSFRYRSVQVNSLMFWHSVVVSVLHCGLAICLAYYGLFAIRMWA